MQQNNSQVLFCSIFHKFSILEVHVTWSFLSLRKIIHTGTSVSNQTCKKIFWSIPFEFRSESKTKQVQRNNFFLFLFDEKCCFIISKILRRSINFCTFIFYSAFIHQWWYKFFWTILLEFFGTLLSNFSYSSLCSCKEWIFFHLFPFFRYPESSIFLISDWYYM